MTDRFIDRCTRREARKSLDQNIVFGLVFAIALLAAGAWLHWFSPEASRETGPTLLAIGATVLIITLVIPSAWTPFARLLRQVAGYAGHFLLVLVLSAIYAALFVPVGLWLRSRGDNPIVEWQGGSAVTKEGWRNVDRATPSGASGTAHRGVFAVLSYFIQRGNWFFLPVLILLISLGLLLFFVQSSVFAPFIYVLF